MKVPTTLTYDKDVKNRKSTIPKPNKNRVKITFFDLETDINCQSEVATDHFKLGVVGFAVYQKDGLLESVDYYHVNSVKELHRLLSMLILQEGAMILAAHNVSFDMQVGGIMRWLKEQNAKLDLWYKAMTTTIISGSLFDTKITIIDTMNHWPMSLENVGKAIGVPKMEIDFENCSREYLAKYCQNDVMVMVHSWATLHQMLYSNWKLRPKLTLASSTVACYKTNPNWQKIRSHLNTEVHKDSYRSYFGGRVELFRHGEFSGKTLHKVDVNSLYPAVMCKYPYPIKFASTLQNPSERVIEEVINDFVIIAKVDLNMEKPQFPYRHNDNTQYPTGTFTTFLAGMEFAKAFNQGNITRVHHANLYQCDNIFTNYIHRLNTLKEQYGRENNLGKREVAKRLMNSLYGKFAQLGFTNEYDGHWEKDQYLRGIDMTKDYKNPIPFMVLNHEKYLLQQNVILPHTQPHIAACITANARSLMWEYFNKAGLENCYYSDTDSIIVNDLGLENLQPYLNEHELGLLKNEGSTDYLRIYARKAYLWGEKRVTKGIPKNSVEQENNRYKYLTYRSLPAAVFQTDKSIPFKFWQHRTLKDVIPDGYVVKDGVVIPPHYGWQK